MFKSKVCFIGFFGMQKKHADTYINMWRTLDARADYESYTIADIMRIPRSRHDIIRETFQPKQPHYDTVHCISGGSLYFLLLLQAKKTFTFSKIVFDSGPYTYDHKQTQIYAREVFPITKLLPVKTILNTFHGISTMLALQEEHEKHILYTPHPKLILTSKVDKTFDREFVDQYTRNSGAHRIEFEKGKHANIYNDNKEEYIQSISDFISK
jgi:hypothetical protein